MKPLHTANMLGKRLRFFRSPLPGDDLPWHSIADLYEAVGLPHALRQQEEARIRLNWTADVRSIVSDGATLTIAPHWMVQGFTGAFDEAAAGRELADGEEPDGPVLNTYCNALHEANNKLLLLLGLTPNDGVSRTLRAVMRQPGEGGGNVH